MADKVPLMTRHWELVNVIQLVWEENGSAQYMAQANVNSAEPQPVRRAPRVSREGTSSHRAAAGASPGAPQAVDPAWQDCHQHHSPGVGRRAVTPPHRVGRQDHLTGQLVRGEHAPGHAAGALSHPITHQAADLAGQRVASCRQSQQESLEVMPEGHDFPLHISHPKSSATIRCCVLNRQNKWVQELRHGNWHGPIFSYSQWLANLFLPVFETVGLEAEHSHQGSQKQAH